MLQASLKHDFALSVEVGREITAKVAECWIFSRDCVLVKKDNCSLCIINFGHHQRLEFKTKKTK